MSGKQIAVNPLYWIGGDYFTLTTHVPENITQYMGTKVDKLNRRPFVYPAMKLETRRELVGYFYEQSKQLSGFIDVDLNEWIK